MIIRPGRGHYATPAVARAMAALAQCGPSDLHVWLRRAATEGIFPTRSGVRRLLDGRPLAADETGWLEAGASVIRPARAADLPALEALEALCWDAPLRATPVELSARLRSDDHHVLELGGELGGVLYSQRIAAIDAIFGVDFRRAQSLRRGDGPVRQLLAINIDPAAQTRGLGDALLKFVLQLAAFEPGIERVCGVTRCGGRRPDSTLAEYVASRDGDGLPLDPILAFHAAHGARIGPVVDGYRPPDSQNGGAGVLVEYDPRARLRAADALAAADGPPRRVVEGAIRELMPEGQVFDPGRPLRELGFDSFRLVRLRAVLARRLGRAVRPTLSFRHSSAAALVAFFEGPATSRSGRHPVPSVEAVAIVGLSCRLPGGVRDPDGFWALIEEGRDAISAIPADRFGGAPIDAPDFGGYLDGIADFDAAFFRIAPVEAEAMDPQQRVLLEAHWQALEHAGINPTSLAGADVGIFVGAFAEDYKLLQARRPGPLSTYFGTGTADAIAAGRVAYVLGTRGPAMVVDTACSSSLVAVHQAVRSLRSGESTLALASGINLILSPALNEVFARAGMLAPDGRCKSFDAAADGYARSEGCGVVVLERLSSARANRRHTLGLIRGTAINQDGASNGLTAPDGSAQEAVVRKALVDADLPPGSIGYVEAHGTGTPLGDPIEVEALDAVYGPGRPASRPLWVGSVKTNIGHTESAAGIAGLIKTVLALGRGRIPRNLHCRTLNPHLAKTRVRVPCEILDWPRGETPRRAGVSSFGFSGTNAHVIVEEAPGAVAQAARRTHHLLTLSACTPDALRTLADQTAQALAAAGKAALGERGRLMSRAAGRMAAVRAGEQAVEACIAGLDGVTIGVINGPRSLVISGRHDAVDAAIERLHAAGIDTRILDSGRWLVLGDGPAAALAVRLEADAESLDGDWRAGLERWLAAAGGAPGGVDDQRHTRTLGWDTDTRRPTGGLLGA